MRTSFGVDSIFFGRVRSCSLNVQHPEFFQNLVPDFQVIFPRQKRSYLFQVQEICPSPTCFSKIGPKVLNKKFLHPKRGENRTLLTERSSMRTSFGVDSNFLVGFVGFFLKCQPWRNFLNVDQVMFQRQKRSYLYQVKIFVDMLSTS